MRPSSSSSSKASIVLLDQEPVLIAASPSSACAPAPSGPSCAGRAGRLLDLAGLSGPLLKSLLRLAHPVPGPRAIHSLPAPYALPQMVPSEIAISRGGLVLGAHRQPASPRSRRFGPRVTAQLKSTPSPLKPEVIMQPFRAACFWTDEGRLVRRLSAATLAARLCGLGENPLGRVLGKLWADNGIRATFFFAARLPGRRSFLA